MTTATISTITAKELLQLPDNGMRRELVRGEVREFALADAEHGELAMAIGWRLGHHVETRQLGNAYAAGTGFILARNPDTVRAPDAAFVRQEVIDATGRLMGFRPSAPDLAIEVISPGDVYQDVEDKVMEWLEAGCRMVVVINPRRHTVTVYRSRTDIVILTEEDTLQGGDVVAGWEVPVAELFA